MKKDITVVVPAYNEAGNIEVAIRNVVEALRSQSFDYEIILVNDGSTDATGKIGQKLADKNHKIKICHHRDNLGVGKAFVDGVKLATKSYVTVFPADNDMAATSLIDLVRRATAADIVISYMDSDRRRSIVRRVLSRTYTFLLNSLFGLHLKYYNGPFICKLSLLKKISLKSPGFMIYAELKVKLIKAGCGFLEIPFHHTGRIYGESKALTTKSLFQTIYAIMILFFDIYGRKDSDDLSSH